MLLYNLHGGGFMWRDIVRLSSLTIKNIKNVKNGTIIMPHENDRSLDCGGAEILGIYGQNGSGKTAIVDTFSFLQQIMIGEELDTKISDYIDTDSESAEVNAEFNIFSENTLYEVGYNIIFAKSDDGIFIDYNRNDNEAIFKPQKRLEELIGKNKDIKTDLIVAKKMAEKSNCSYIFGENSREILFNNVSDKFKNYEFVLKALFRFAVRDLFVIDNSHSGMISTNVLLPMSFRVDKEKVGMKGDFAVPLMEPFVLDSERKELLGEIVDQINTVLYTIIPGMRIDIKDYGKQTLDSGEEGWKVELMSVRGDKKPIPIRMESDGIIKIISILNALIQAFSNSSICLVIDELDAGIFEYLLGELLDIFSKSAKGQLIFTSHNLRALEMLDKESIMFSTVNPDNRYIHMKNVKDSNNLRSMYIRSITLGGQEETIYEETDSLKISRAFRKAGKLLYEERKKSCNGNS